MTAVPGVDWLLASSIGQRLIPPGVPIARSDVAAVVAELRDCANIAVDAVATTSRIAASAPSEVLIVDRAGWLRAAIEMSAAMLGAVGQLTPRTLGERVSARVAGVQLGAAFAFVGTRILGQFDPYSPAAKLLLVAPNIVAAERQLGVEPRGFRQWVCLHEQTHRTQFGAAPWLARHLLDQMRRLFADTDEAPPRVEPASGLGRLLSPGQQAGFDSITAVMSLLEGHADVIMDAAAPGLVPQVDRLRAAMEARRDAPGLVQLISRLLGLRAKREQYLHGAAFCRRVIDSAGMATLNLAFSEPRLLPTLPELHQPEAWLGRVRQPVG